jgi:1,4-dihydroxy-2-naphthoate octaprenyltransferase
MSETEKSPGRFQVWFLAARPKTLWAAIAPVTIGGGLAHADLGFYTPAFIAALFGAIFIQIGTNFANDLADFRNKVDAAGRLGPLRATQAGLVTPRAMMNATILAFSIAFVFGIYLVIRGGWPIMIVGLASILFGVLYTAGPYPLSYNGTADVFVLLFFGPVAVAGTYYVCTLDLSSEAIYAGIAPGLMSTAILTVNNLRDIETDNASGKRTLAVRLGEKVTRRFYVVLVLLALLYPLFHYLLLRQQWGILLALLAFIPAVALIRKVLAGTTGRPLNDVLAGTGRLLAIFAILFSIGCLL